MYVCARLTVPPADAWGVATFYGLFATTPRPRRVLHVCDDIACRNRGGLALIERLERETGPAHHAPAGDHVDLPATAWQSSGRPADRAYWSHDPASALTAASLTKPGPSKSGKPWARLTAWCSRASRGRWAAVPSWR